MGFREWAEKNQKTVTGIVTGLVLIMSVVVGVEVFGGHRGYPKKMPDSYFTDDDGKTFFVGGAENNAPFNHNGRTAVRAYVFRCNGKKFVGYLERYLPDVKAKLDGGAILSAEMVRFGRDMKRPGDPTWTHVVDLTTEARIENVACPGGGSEMPEELEP